MISQNYWAHSGGNKNWFDFIYQNDHELNNVGEILARGDFKTPEGRQEAWMNSPKHKEAIVSDYKYFGSAICRYGDKKVLTVVHFGKEV